MTDNSNGEWQQDDGWFDVLSNGDKPYDSDCIDRSTAGSIDSVAHPELLSDMPSIFNTDLPPCGLHPQIAFENVNKLLRKDWLEHTNDTASTVSILGICERLLRDLKAEQQRRPCHSLRFTGTRRPWRLENVFRYELYWSQYFVREAEIQEKLAVMGEEERATQESGDRTRPIPKELRLAVKNKDLEGEILKQWNAWRRTKRGNLAAIEDSEVQIATEAMSLAD